MSGLKSYSSRADHSVLKQSIEVSKTGMKQAIHALECGSKEVVDVLLNECSIIYECKVCFNLFRSISNFLAHKRTFCKNKSQKVLHHFNNPDQETADKLVIVQPEPVETVFPEAGFELQDYSPSIELLKEAGILDEIEERPLVNTLLPSNSKPSQSKLSGIVKSLIAKRNAQESEDATRHQVLLEPLKQSTRAVFQTYLLGDQSAKPMGQRYSELVKARRLGSAFIGPDNKIVDPGQSTRSFSPSMANFPTEFNEKKSVKSKPGPKRSKEDDGYPCTKCNSSYSRLYKTINHLKKVHNLLEADVREERQKIKRLATKTQYGQGSCYYGSELILERLSPDEISKWQSQNSSSESGISDENQNKEASSENRTDFKLLAQELNVKNVKVSLPRISPSRFISDRDSKSPSLHRDEESTSDNEVTINNKDTIPSSVRIPILNNGGKKRRSRSSSPSSVSTSSSREENPGNSNSKRLRRETSLPLFDDENRKVLGTLNHQDHEEEEKEKEEEKSVPKRKGSRPKQGPKSKKTFKNLQKKV